MAAISSHVLDSVPDPTDFPPQTTAPGLRKLDSNFRCSICGEIFDAPITIRCGHCFCSGCIRPAMAVKQECPICRKTANEDHIRPNYVMEEAISAWNESRPYVLGLIKREQEVATLTPNASQKPRKRKRTGSDSSIEIIGDSAGPSTPRTLRPRYATASPHKADQGITVPSSDVEEDELDSHSALNPKSNAMVNCPICSKKVQFSSLNTHIDRGCKDPVKAKEKASVEWSKIMASGPNKQKGKQRKHSDSDDEQPLPKASYATLKEKQIRELLKEHDLSTQGDRSMLEQRHQRWVMIYNSNLDRSGPNRKSKAALRQELKKWEEGISKKKKPSVDAKQHAKTYKSEFDQLINDVRGSLQRARTIPSSVSPQPMSPSREAPATPLLLPVKEEIEDKSAEAIEIED